MDEEQAQRFASALTELCMQHGVRISIMEADLELKRKQIAWETSRNLAIIVGAVAAISAALTGWTGYQIGRTQPATQFALPPGTTIQVPPAKP